MYSTLFAFFTFAIVSSFLCSLWEAVLLSINPIFAQLKMQEGTFIGNRLQHFKKNIDKPLAAILTLNTFAHTIGAIGVGEQATLIWFDSNPMITGVIVPVVMTIAILILSEIIPKTIGANYWRRLSGFTVYSISILLVLLYPLVWLCQIVTKMFRRDVVNSIFTRRDFVTLTEMGEQGGIFKAEEADMIERAIELYELRVTEVMRPANEMVTIDKDSSVTKLLELVKKHRYSRYPVYDSSNNQIVGIVHIKDLITSDKKTDQAVVADLMRPVLKVQTRLPVNNLLRRFREGMPHFALVYKGQENLVGYITLDNVLQVLLGIIKDEFHQTHMDYVLNADGTISATGLCSIYKLEQALDIDIDTDDDEIETIGGLVLHFKEAFPEQGDKMSFPYFDLTVEKMEDTRILQVKIYPK